MNALFSPPDSIETAGVIIETETAFNKVIMELNERIEEIMHKLNQWWCL